MRGNKKKKGPKKPEPRGGKVISIVGDVQRRRAEEARTRATSTHRREAEAAADFAATTAALEELDIDGAIAACDTLPPDQARVSRAQFRALGALRRCMRGDEAGGLAEWAEIFAEEPDIASNYLMRAGWLKKTDPRAALADVERAVALEPQNPVMYARRGDFHVMVDDLDRAIADYRRSIAIDPQQADVHYQLGKILAAKGDLAEALKAYDRAVQLAPIYVDFRVGRGEVLLRLEEHKRALTEFDRVIAMAPRDADAHVGRAKALASLGDIQGAIKEVTRAAELSPGHAWAHMLRAVYVNGQEGEAARDRVKADLAQAVETEPNNPAFLLKRGEYLMQFGDIPGGLADTEKAIAIAPMLPQLYYSRGYGKARLAEHRREQDPSWVEAPEERRARLADALADLEKALAMGHVTEELHLEIVRAHMERGDSLDVLRAALDRALAALPDSEQLLRLRYETRRRTGDADGAARDRARMEALGLPIELPPA